MTIVAIVGGVVILACAAVLFVSFAHADKLSIETRDQDDVTVVTVVSNGEFDDRTHDAIVKVLDDLRARGRTRLVLDAARLESFPPDGWGLLFTDLYRLRRSGGDIRVAALTEESRALLEELKLLERLSEHATVDKAIESFDGEPPGTPFADRLWFETDQEDGIALLTLHGTVDSLTVAQVESAVGSLASPRVVLDGNEIVNVTPEGMAHLCKLATTVREKGGAIHLCAFWGIPRVLLDSLGVAAFFEEFETRSDAIDAFKAK